MSGRPKHLRPRFRYLAIGLRSWPDAALTRSGFQEAAWRACRSLLGDAGSAGVHLRVLTFEFADGRGEAVIRVTRGQVEPARGALACIGEIDGDPVGLRVRGVSGTVRACEENYLRNQREPTDQSQVAFDGATRRAWRAGNEVDVRVDDAYVGATPLDLQ